MAGFWSAPAHEIFAAGLSQSRAKPRVGQEMGAVLGDNLVARAVAADDERVTPLAGAADIDGAWRDTVQLLVQYAGHGEQQKSAPADVRGEAENARRRG